MKAIFPTGESKKKKILEASTPNTSFCFCYSASITQLGQNSCNNIRAETEKRGGSKEIEGRRGRERGGQRGSIFIFPELGLSLNGRKEELC